MSTCHELHGGEFINLDNPKLEAITFDSIAFQLSHIVRYNGAMGQYSVAEHCVHAARMALHAGETPMQILAVLLHDGHEHVTGDISSPLQRYFGSVFMADFQILKNELDALICEKLDISAALMHNNITREYDHAMLTVETWHGLPSMGEHVEWSHLRDLSPATLVKYEPHWWNPSEAERAFTDMFWTFYPNRHTR